jgi:hypothetical protein
MEKVLSMLAARAARSRSDATVRKGGLARIFAALAKFRACTLFAAADSPPFEVIDVLHHRPHLVFGPRRYNQIGSDTPK